MIVLVMAISNLVLTRQIYSQEANGAHAHYREPVPLTVTIDGGYELNLSVTLKYIFFQESVHRHHQVPLTVVHHQVQLLAEKGTGS